MQLRFSGARVSATAVVNREANIKPGPIRVKDTALLYPFESLLARVHMNGAQLKEFMEYSTRYFNTWQPGDLTFSFNEEVMPFMYMIFKGVNYSIDVSKEPGQRIQDLTWPDGTPVRDDEEFDLAVCDYIVNSILCKPGVVFSSEEEMPVVEDADVGGSRGNIRALIEDYIEGLPDSTLYPYCDHSWKIIGNDWDPALHEKAVQLLASGEIAEPNNEEGSSPFCQPVREEDLPQ